MLFRELYQNPNLQRAIRSHMVVGGPRSGASADARLARAAAKSLRAAGWAPRRSGSGFGFGFGSRPGGRQAAAIKHPHTLCCRLFAPPPGLGLEKAKRANRKKSRKKNKKKSTGKGMSANSSSAPSFRSTAGNDFAQAKETSGGISVAGLSEDELTASASAHRDFLLQTLHNVREQLSNPSPLVVTGAEAGIPEGVAEELADPVSCLTCPLSKVVKKKKKRKRSLFRELDEGRAARQFQKPLRRFRRITMEHSKLDILRSVKGSLLP